MTLTEIYDLPEEELVDVSHKEADPKCTTCHGQGVYREYNEPSNPWWMGWWVVCDCVAESIGEPSSV